MLVVQDAAMTHNCPCCCGDKYAQPGAECGAGKLPGDVGFRSEVYRREVEEEFLRRCVRAVEAMPDFAGRKARADGMTHRCTTCGEWVAEADTRLNVIAYRRAHRRRFLRDDGRWETNVCGPVHDLSSVEGVLRADVIAVLRRVMAEEQQHE